MTIIIVIMLTSRIHTYIHTPGVGVERGSRRGMRVSADIYILVFVRAHAPWTKDETPAPERMRPKKIAKASVWCSYAACLTTFLTSSPSPIQDLQVGSLCICRCRRKKSRRLYPTSKGQSLPQVQGPWPSWCGSKWAAGEESKEASRIKGRRCFFYVRQ